MGTSAHTYTQNLYGSIPKILVSNSVGCWKVVNEPDKEWGIQTWPVALRMPESEVSCPVRVFLGSQWPLGSLVTVCLGLLSS